MGACRVQDAIIVFPEEKMKLRDDDKKWFAAEIARQLEEVVDSFKPHGWQKLIYWLRLLGPLAASLAIVLTLVGITLGALYQSFAQVKEEATFRTKTEDRLNNIDKQLLGLQILNSSNLPSRTENQVVAKEILKDVKDKNISIPTSIVNQAGVSFVDASKNDPKAWPVALDFISYRTVLNKDLALVGTAKQIATTPLGNFESHYLTEFLPGYEHPKMSVGGDVSFDRAANIYPLNEKPLDAGQSRGKEVILIEGGGIGLDGMAMKNVVIRNTVVGYSGGPMSLQNVIFVNCTFLFPLNQESRDLGRALLASSAVTFSTIKS
jgi:hypothetical protein